LPNDANINPDMTGSPGHPPGPGRATPRTAAPHQSYYPQNTGYNTPPRVQQTTSNLYNVVSNDRGQSNAGPGGDVYAPAADMSNSMPNGYASQPPLMNGSAGGMKRGREDEEDLAQSGSEGHMANGDHKRRRTMMENSISAPAYDAMNRPASAIAAPRRR
jgi:protein SOK2